MGECSCDPRTKKYSRLYAFLSFALICFYMVTELVFELWYRVAANYGLFLIVSFIALSFFLRFFSSSREEKCVFAFALWLYITRALNGDVFLDMEFYHVVRTVLFSISFICVGFVLDSADRKRFLCIVCAVVCLYWFVLAAVGIYATLSFQRIALPPADMSVGIAYISGNFQLSVDNIHRNVSGVWFALAVIMMAILFFRCKNRFWRIAVCIAALVFYVAAALSFCRAAQIGLAVALTMLVMLLLLRHFASKGTRFKALLCAAAILCLPVFYKSYGLITQGCGLISGTFFSQAQSLYIASLPVEEGEGEAEETPAEEADAEESSVFAESRGMDSVMALGGRVPLWKSGFICLQQESSRLIKGELLSRYMDTVAAICKRIAPDNGASNGQMHNYILDALLLTGIPGALLLILFTLMVLWKMLKVFFSDAASFENKLLTLPLAFFFMDNLMEAHIFRYALVNSILFFLICGIFLAESYELFPGKKR